MSDNKKYYYLKLRDNFFDNDDIAILESMPDGILYSNILLKLYLRSLKNNGTHILVPDTRVLARMTASILSGWAWSCERLNTSCSLVMAPLSSFGWFSCSSWFLMFSWSCTFILKSILTIISEYLINWDFEY